MLTSASSTSRFLLATVLTVLLIFLNVVYSIPTPDVSGGQSPLPGWSQLKYFFVFGDSYTQTGFNLTDGSPLPTPGNPLGNPPYPGFTSSSGPNWIDFLTTEFNQSDVLTYNMSFGGATVDEDLIVAFEPTVLSIKDQVQTLFLPNLANQTFWTSSDSLFFIWDGVNDVGRTYSSGVDLDALYNQVIAEYFVLVNELYDAGARNFMFLDVPPIERSPGTTVLGPDVEAEEKSARLLFNGKLTQSTGQLLKNHTDAKAFIFKSSAVFTKLLDDPAPFGIKNTTDFCQDYSGGTSTPTTFLPECGVPVNEYLWLNTLHPTWTVHQEVAKELANFV